jgi:hypothetical protein
MWIPNNSMELGMQGFLFYFFHIVECHVPLPINKSWLKLLGRLIELADQGIDLEGPLNLVTVVIVP